MIWDIRWFGVENLGLIGQYLLASKLRKQKIPATFAPFCRGQLLTPRQPIGVLELCAESLCSRPQLGYIGIPFCYSPIYSRYGAVVVVWDLSRLFVAK